LKRKIYIFDLDYTIVNCNTFFVYTIFVLKFNYCLLIKKIFFLFIYSILFKTTKNELYKSIFISLLLKNIKKKDFEKINISFCNYIVKNKLNNAILTIIKKQKLKKKFYIATASPDFYVKLIAKKLNAKNYFATKINLKKKNFGTIIGKNCFGSQKKIVVFKNIKNLKNYKTYFYTDSLEDKPLLEICDNSYVVSNKSIYSYIKEH